MGAIAKKIDYCPELPPLPTGFSEQVYKLALKIGSSDEAKQTFQVLDPLLDDYQVDENMLVVFGLLTEKITNGTDLGNLWGKIQNLCPDDDTARRMKLRWCRRNGEIQEGVDLLASLYPESPQDLNDARGHATGLIELKAWDELDRLIPQALMFQPEDRNIRMSFIKALSEQQRFSDAAEIAQQVANRDRMGAASQKLLNDVEKKATLLSELKCLNSADIIDKLIAKAPKPDPIGSRKNLVFFSGQLGTGGAERQMTRLACAYHERYLDDDSNLKPHVWVKHANPETGADFYLPMLKEAKIPTKVLTDEPEFNSLVPENISEEIKDMLSLLAPDVRAHTNFLTEMFIREDVEVAYLWQDGGIVQSAIAAVLAGVPKIITSFRGLPPNLRPRLFREELPVLYSALSKLPHVTFSANSQKAATAYEEWLELPEGSIEVIPNAIPDIPPDGDKDDQKFWDDMIAASKSCTKTVIGVFRYDENKRPLEWIRAAARYLDFNDDTRFVVLGDGALRSACDDLIVELGLENRVFLAGIRSNVGFYLHRSDLMLHLARMEGLPNVLIESQLAGTPVLATPAGGTREVVEDRASGIVLSTAKTVPLDELDWELSALLQDEERLKRMGAAAIYHSGERFSVKTIVERTNKLFRYYGGEAI